MSILDTFIMAFTNLWRRKLRTVLTALGMAVGTISIVVMISVGIGFQRSFEEQIANYGSLTQIQVQAGWDSRTGQQNDFDKQTLSQIEALEHITAVLPIAQYNGGNLKSGRNRGWVQMYGVDFALAEAFGFLPTTGGLPEGHAGRNAIEAVMTADIGYDMEPPRRNYGRYEWIPYEEREPNVKLMEDKIQFSFDWGAFENNFVYGEGQVKGKIYTMEVSGIVDNITTNRGNYWNTAFVDINTMNALLKENKAYTNYDPKRSTITNVLAQADHMDNVAATVEEIRALGLDAWGQGEWISQQQDTVKMIQNVLGAIGAVAMLVAAIGIMNTMLMSIVERTREIGVIKVLGCGMGNILTLFLAEAASIGLIGGCFGLGLSYGISYVINNLAQLMGGDSAAMLAESIKSVIPPWLALTGVVFSALVALISGLYPSIRAMRLSALEAIRNQ